MHAMWRGEHLRAQLRKKQVHAMWRGEHLRARPPKKPVEAVRLTRHLRAQPEKKQLQGLPAEGGLVVVGGRIYIINVKVVFLSKRKKHCGHGWTVLTLAGIRFTRKTYNKK